MKRIAFQNTCLALAALGAAAAVAENYDPTGKAGVTNDLVPATIIYGGGPVLPVERYIPWAIPSASAGQNHAQLRLVADSLLGGASTFSSTGLPQFLFAYGTVDFPCPVGGPLVSNNIEIDEFPYADGRSNTMGRILPDGTFVYRANFDAAPVLQNNVEWVPGMVCPQTPFPEPGSGTAVFAAVASGDFLSIPSALEKAAGPGFFVAMSNFQGTGGSVPTGVNIWDYSGAALPIAAPGWSYSQTGAEVYFGIPAGTARQSPPVLARVGCGAAVRNYVLFGVGTNGVPFNNGNGTGGSGGRRPQHLVVSQYQASTAYADAVILDPPAGEFFVANQATGGGGEPFYGNKFAINRAGQLAILTQKYDALDPNKLHLSRQSVRLYNACFKTDGTIGGFTEDPASPIADAGAGDVVADGLLNTSSDPNIAFDQISGVGINDAGNITFTARYLGPDPNDPNLPPGSIPRTAVYFWVKATDTLYQVTREDDNVGTGPFIKLGRMAQGTSATGATTTTDAFFAQGAAPNTNAAGLCFAPNTLDPTPVRGVLVLNVRLTFQPKTDCPRCPRCDGDADGDGDVDQDDLDLVLFNFGTAGWPPFTNGDVDGDGDVDQDDLDLVLFNFGCA